MRKNPLSSGSYYHIINRSIAKYEIFNTGDDCRRIIEILDLYRFSDFPCKYSKFTRLSPGHQKAIANDIKKSGETMVEIIAYCIMSTHIHLLLKQEADNGISRYMAKVLGSYSLYFNIKHKRRGPLWEGRFKNVLLETDEQMLHLTRYIHLNPVSAGLVKKPEDWQYSSYHEYVSKDHIDGMCRFEGLMDIDPKEYKKFVRDRIAYQKELSKIKHFLIEDYSG